MSASPASAPPRPAGRLLRRHWQPVALVEELDGPRPVRAIRALGEDYVLFRDERGRLGLIDRGCPHRGADMAYGRLGGWRAALRLPWLAVRRGRKCLETPAEPEGSTLCQRIRTRSYPGAVRSGIVFAYLGPGEAPALPGFDCFVAPTPTASPSRG
jgi:phenylpropionate dioxygenase-like ring-hydroxylating dioxygenase large terminal subunit